MFDDIGVESCEPARVTVEAVRGDDLYIELTWRTPGDPDETDANGADLDLHLLHPNGQWNQAPFDIFWNHPHGEWGAPGGGDDPQLEREDSDGAGPEIISLNNPESGLAYSVGAYYFDDHGFGPSLATVRIRSGGQLIHEAVDRELRSTGVFWNVASISWPSRQALAVDKVRIGFP